MTRHPIAVIVLAQLFGTSLWFSANSAADDLMRQWGASLADIGSLTNATQLGFILGTLVFAVSGLADRFPAGSQTTAYYDPDEPTRAVLLTGAEHLPSFLVLFLTPFHCVAVGLWVMVVRIGLPGIISADKFNPGMLNVLLGATAVMILAACSGKAANAW